MDALYGIIKSLLRSCLMNVPLLRKQLRSIQPSIESSMASMTSEVAIASEARAADCEVIGYPGSAARHSNVPIRLVTISIILPLKRVLASSVLLPLYLGRKYQEWGEGQDSHWIRRLFGNFLAQFDATRHLTFLEKLD